MTLRSSLVCDILDSLGAGARALGPDIVALTGNTCLVGPAFTARSVEVAAASGAPYAKLLEALDAVGRDEVFVLATDRSERAGVWGELLSTTCQARGAAGTVTDGYTRDAEEIRALGYPVFTRGTFPLDSAGRSELVDFGGTIVIDGVEIVPGDLIVADSDGVVVVPAALAEAVRERAAVKASDEGSFLDAVRNGMSATEAYARFRVL
jgi:regulator of RNase E activity RraA